jgi:hypothetical protein
MLRCCLVLHPNFHTVCNISGKPFGPQLIAEYQCRFPGRAPEFAIISGVPLDAARSKID